MAEAGGKKVTDIGLLILRFGIGAAFIIFGVPKLLEGPEGWKSLGKAVELFNIHYAPEFWGFMCGFAEAIGGLFLILGLLVRPFAFIMFINMVVATAVLITSAAAKGHGYEWYMMDSFQNWFKPASMGVVFLALVFMGGGRFGISAMFKGGKKASPQ